jgi:hypothetical protein
MLKEINQSINDSKIVKWAKKKLNIQYKHKWRHAPSNYGPSRPEKTALMAEMNRLKEGKVFTECGREFQSTALLTIKDWNIACDLWSDEADEAKWNKEKCCLTSLTFLTRFWQHLNFLWRGRYLILYQSLRKTSLLRSLIFWLLSNKYITGSIHGHGRYCQATNQFLYRE